MDNVRVLQLYDMYAEDVYKLAYSYMGAKADAEDIVQNVYLKLLQKTIHISKGNEKAYILRMTVNVCKDAFKSRKPKVPYEDVMENSAGTCFTDTETELLNAVGTLPEKYRVVIHLFYYEGYSVREISAMLKISMSAVTMRLSRGRERLKGIIEKEDWSL